MKLLIFLAVLSVVASERVGSLIRVDEKPEIAIPKGPFEEPKNFTDALEHCKRLGKNVMVPRYTIQNAGLYYLMEKRGIKRLWIGISRRHDVKDSDTKTFKYDGFNLTVRDPHWGPKEPNNFRKHQERCAEIRVLAKNDPAFGSWNDAPCDRLNHFLCS